MSTVEHALPDRTALRGDRRLKVKLRELCRTDNWTNFLYIGRVYVVLALTIGGAIAFDQFRQAAALGWWWNAPVYFLAILAIGASHHQLAGAGHEATHHTLFRGRLLNELASDWLCMFPIFGVTYSFRLYHLAHHQFINDPKRDPDFAMLAASGHWLRFPVSKALFLGTILRQFLLVGLVRYILVRFRFNSTGLKGASPYRRGGEAGSKLPVRIGTLYLLALAMAQMPLYAHGSIPVLMGVSLASWLALSVIFLALPARLWEEARLRPVVPRHWIAVGRMFYLSSMVTALTCLQLVTAAPVWWYFLWLWVVPLLTSFSLFMILRQVIQHGNGDRGWLTNTRVFLVNPIIRYAVFPFGMDYHLPHHMYATVPHYNLPKLHRFLLAYPEYASDALIVENYIVPKSGGVRRNPTCIEVVGPDYARAGEDIHIDHSVLDAWDVDERDEIARHEQLSIDETDWR